ncbi:type II toxin-antitoxin system death-on-curing family toxin [Sphingobium sp. Z007]|uniref:type II toxin-antitoxin system death-on-curing family toxin n=1 Tax=Sphingobium sp. Z007 TaxID=627495 RepID=UPI000B49777E|nr:type II toxin-antitoxin system death-on-curing family toxin [Sphingobium sp. Z007]
MSVQDENRAEPVWIEKAVALAIHDRQLAEHGGGTGTRDEGMLESALARPVNQWTYGEEDRCALAAAYAFGVVRNHPFADGNKRTGWVLARLFLALNDMALSFDPTDATQMMLAFAAGEIGQDDLADWFRQHLRPA